MFGYKSILREHGPGMGTALGICLMSLALHFGADHGYAGSTQVRPAFIVLAVRAATAAAARAGRRAGAGSEPGTPGRWTRQVQSAEGEAPGNCLGQEQVGPELADIVSRLRRAMRRAARAADPGLGLSVAQLELLSCMAEHPGIRPSQLARMLRLAPSSVATLLGGLQSAGY